MESSWTWVDELIFKKREPEMELPEDIVMHMISLNPLMEKLIEAYELEIET